MRTNRKNNAPITPRCAICGKTPEDGANVVVSEGGAAICEECAKSAVKIIAEGMGTGHHEPHVQQYKKERSCSHSSHGSGRLLTPREMVTKLDEYVVGQDEVKKTLATAIYNHYIRIRQNSGLKVGKELDEVQIDKSNVLMIGPTGSGKTLLAKTIAKILDVPFAIADATTLTEAGYVGEDVENVVRYLYNNAGGDVKRTEQGIIMIDEICKVASKTQNVSITRDVSGEGVQQALLKIVEGTICRFPPQGGRKHPEQQLVEIDTSNILFICGGAFVGLDKIVDRRVKEENGDGVIGFGTDAMDSKKINRSHSERVRPEDLVAYGLIPEFVGRLPIIAEMKELTEDDLVRVLTEPKNSLTKQYRKLLLQSGVDVTYDESALRYIARRAIERNTGARGLRAEMEEIMKDIMFTAPENNERGKVIHITESFVEKAA